jgi:hypothetical protein
MKHRHLFDLGIVLILVTLLASACAPATPEKITITFTADRQCTMEGATTIPANEDATLEVISNLKETDTVGIGIMKPDPGKTLQDYQDLPLDNDEPDWSLRVGFYEFPSDGNPHTIILNQADGPIYFFCFTPEWRWAVGPIGVK